MLVAFSFIFFWIIFSLFSRVCFSLSVSVLVIRFLFCVLSCYSGFFCSSVVSLYGGVDLLGGVLVGLSIWVSILMFLVSFKYGFGNLYSSLFSLSVGSLLLVVVVFFYTDSLLVFYVMFESSLFPTLYLIIK